jgi:16S rRNA (adenine1518-N6/adenine1519-N6)-dimethyltransferase
MKLSEMREWLERRDIQLTKSLGQNFLHDAHQLERITAAAELTPQDQVLEIGPGLGPLTRLLLERAGKVLAIEKDFRLVEVLRERFAAILSPAAPGGGPAISQAPAEKFELLHADALDFLKAPPHDWRDWKLVANLPYSVASPILVELAAGMRAPKMMVVTLQLEVVRRLMAQTDDDDYGILTLLVQLDFRPRDWFKIPPGCFFPAPDVDSACVILQRREQPLLPEHLRPVFHKIIKRAFSQRRKMMLKLLKQDWPAERLAAVFAELNISPLERAEKLSLEQFAELTLKLGA